MNRRERRAFKAQWDSQINQERNAAAAGASYVPPEIAAHMTKPKPPEMLYQVVVEKCEGGVMAVGPMMIHQVAEEFAKVINACVAAGKEKTWRNATVVACLPVGVH